MNNCKKMRQVILTDYIDGELDNNAKKTVEGHLRSCPACASLLKRVKEGLKPLEGLPAESVPSGLWTSINEKLSAPEPAWNPFAALLGLLSSRNFAPAFAAVVVLMLAGLFTFNKQLDVYRENERSIYISEVFNSNSTYADGDTVLGASIEEYFL